MATTNHIWNFSTVGGVKRVNLESGSDLANLADLDPKLWTALSCPVNDLEIDKKTLELIDSDKDGQIRVPDILAAVNWILSVIKNPDDLIHAGGQFKLSFINDQTEEGKTLLDSAKIILKNLGKEAADTISVEDTSDTEKIFAGTRFNGDGIITEDSTADAELTGVLNEIMLYSGSVVDRGGKKGVNAEILKSFFEQCVNFAAWHDKKEADKDTILPIDEQTDTAYQNFCKIRSKIDDYFIRCRLAAFDPLTTGILNLQITRVETITAKDLSKCLNEIADYPLAEVSANKLLPVSDGINPAWETDMAIFKELTVGRLFPGHDSLTEAEWHSIQQAFIPYIKWISEMDGASVAPAGIVRVREILLGNYRAQMESLMVREMAVEKESGNIIMVDKMVRYHRDLYTLLKNFVTFYDFYTRGAKAIFQAGTLYIDQRSCDLCIRVRDMAKHGNLASFSGMYLVYCDCVSRSSNEKMIIVAALTHGDVDNLIVGRNALFYDRKGTDWDATIIKIMENPISIRQAFFSPYRKVSRFIETRIHKMASSHDEKVTADMQKSIEKVPLKEEDAKAKKESPTPFDIGKFVGIFAAISLALGAIGTVIASVVGGFMKLEWWKMPVAVAGLLLMISGPSMIIAYLKLRKRNLAPVLDANGWAINARVIINIRFGNTLTHLAELPKGAKVNINDPFTKKKRPLLLVVILIVLLAAGMFYLLWRKGFIHIHI